MPGEFSRRSRESCRGLMAVAREQLRSSSRRAPGQGLRRSCVAESAEGRALDSLRCGAAALKCEPLAEVRRCRWGRLQR